MNYINMTEQELKSELAKLTQQYNDLKAQNLSYDMTRGKPASAQLDLSNEMLSDKYLGNIKTSKNIDCRNYGILDGIPEAKELMASIIGVDPANVIVCGNSSLNIMYDTLMKFMLFGVSKSAKPWCKEEKIKFICPVPGYDRHFKITEQLGIEMINVDLNDDGPDMSKVKELVKDPAVKGMWAVPKYSNPTGTVYSDEVIKELASMECAADDFRIFWDDAYTVHYLYDAPAKQLNILKACCDAGNSDRAVIFTSTSKITFSGSGLSAVASSKDNIEYFLWHMNVQTIGHDKINQLRHVNFLKNYDGVIAHMKKHADIIRPKFEVVLNTLESELSGLGILTWSKPRGGYFISIDTLEGCADKVVAMAKDCGVVFTPAGATFPYGKDPKNKNIRIAPTLPVIEDLKEAIKMLCICVKICSINKILEER
ncbi:MAG: aminotransferase class I/II-fold pyridoxal phosphate-dependent enzyme [Clostridia bacterium]|nr:aminotransferase class I/II-fold pyridoxal phosphate-dependent enzyme [Clostridia bacterium]